MFRSPPGRPALGGEAAIRLIEGPVTYCTTPEAVPLAAAWFKEFQEIRICLAEHLGSPGAIQGQIWPCHPNADATLPSSKLAPP